MLFRFRAVAEATPEVLHHGEVEETWKVAVLWATGTPTFSASVSLKDP
jgi:hypothetical protein